MHQIPEITKNLIIINLLMFLATITLGEVMATKCAMYYLENENFQPYQLVTAFFMHAGTIHLLFNMFSLFMVGGEVEHVLGPKRFLFLYLSVGFGANVLYLLFQYTQVHQLMNGLSPDQIAWSTGRLEEIHQDLLVPEMQALGNIWHSRLVGASGATYGVLLTFAMLYPNRIVYLIIPPIPIKTKYLVLGLIAMDVYYQITDAQTGIAHMVHLAGAGIAVLLVLLWRQQGARF